MEWCIMRTGTYYQRTDPSLYDSGPFKRGVKKDLSRPPLCGTPYYIVFAMSMVASTLGPYSSLPSG